MILRLVVIDVNVTLGLLLLLVAMWEDGCNRALKEAIMKNNMEQSVYHNTSRIIDAERKSEEMRMVREEWKLRTKLQRLQLEQRSYSECDYTGKY